MGPERCGRAGALHHLVPIRDKPHAIDVKVQFGIADFGTHRKLSVFSFQFSVFSFRFSVFGFRCSVVAGLLTEPQRPTAGLPHVSGLSLETDLSHSRCAQKKNSLACASGWYSLPLWLVSSRANTLPPQVSKGMPRDERETFGRAVWLGRETGHNGGRETGHNGGRETGHNTCSISLPSNPRPEPFRRGGRRFLRTPGARDAGGRRRDPFPR